MTDVEELRNRMIEWDRGTWTLAALAIVLNRSHGGAQREAAAAVLDALGINLEDTGLSGELAGQTASMASAPLVQTARLLSGGSEWDEQSDAALLAQGRSSAQAAPLFAQRVFSQLEGLNDRFAEPGARMLDVGVGTAAMAAAFAETFPNLTVVGIDVMPRVLNLAANVVAASPAKDRLQLRQQDVATLGDHHEEGFDLIWIPAPFVPEEPLRAGIARLPRALRTGGWAMIGHGKFGADPVEDAINAFKTVAWGGTALDDAAAEALLTEAGLHDVHTVQTPPGAPALSVGRRRD